MDTIKEDDEQLYRESMQNAYILLTNKLNFTELYDYNGCFLPYNPKKEIDDSVFDELISYFCDLEEYEKCEELKNIKESKEYNKNFINL